MDTQPLDITTRFATIVADPPWPYKTPGAGPLGSSPTHRPKSWRNPDNNSGSIRRYGAMTIAELCALPVPSADNAHLYLWTTNAFIVQAHEIAQAWGFRPITMLTWTKVHHTDPLRVSMKTGYYFRGATEHVVFAVRGSLKLTTKAALPTGYLWPRTSAHSTKPDQFYDLVEQASPGPRLELFARAARLGWERWGDQAQSTIELPGYPAPVIAHPDAR